MTSEREKVLENALREAVNLAEFLYSCLTEDGYEHAHPEMSRATIADLKALVPERELVCVLCGTPWHALSNRCVGEGCSGFCTWGDAKGAKAISWRDYARKIPEPVPGESRDAR
jgi:hypothetical protein